MSTEALEHMPGDALVPVSWVRDVVREVRAEMPDRPEVVTTTQAAELWSYKATTWGQWCRKGRVPGAWQDGDGGIWRMPYESCAAHVERIAWEARQTNTDRRSGPRGPWKRPKTPPAPPRGAGAAGDAEGKVLRLRPSPLERRKAHDAEPGTSGVARGRGAHDAPGGG